jgi:hypothetical protein
MADPAWIPAAEPFVGAASENGHVAGSPRCTCIPVSGA